MSLLHIDPDDAIPALRHRAIAGHDGRGLPTPALISARDSAGDKDVPAERGTDDARTSREADTTSRAPSVLDVSANPTAARKVSQR